MRSIVGRQVEGHAERPVHKLVPATPEQRRAVEVTRALIWWLYADLKTGARDPCPRRAVALRARFDRIFRRQTNYATCTRPTASSLQENSVQTTASRSCTTAMDTGTAGTGADMLARTLVSPGLLVPSPAGRRCQVEASRLWAILSPVPDTFGLPIQGLNGCVALTPSP